MTETFDSLREQGNRQFRHENYTGSLICYTQCLDLQPDSFALYCNRAAALIKLDSMDEAEDDLEKSLNINSDYVPSLLRLAFLMLYKGNVVESLKYYVRAVRVSSRHAHQLSRFKSRLKEAIRLVESRARQQGYSQDYIDNIITDDVRITLDGYQSIRHQSGSNAGIPVVHRTMNPTASFMENGNTQGQNLLGNGAAITTDFPLFQQTVPEGDENGDNANPRIIQGPNGFSASFTLGPNQTNGLMGMLSRVTGQPLDNNLEPQNHPPTPQTPGHDSATRATANRSQETTEESAPDPDIGIPDVIPQNYTRSNDANRNTNIPNLAQQIGNTAQAFIQGRAISGQPLNGADMARGLATTIASQIGHVMSTQSQGQAARANASTNPNDVGSQLRGIAQAAATAFLGSMSPNAGNNTGSGTSGINTTNAQTSEHPSNAAQVPFASTANSSVQNRASTSTHSDNSNNNVGGNEGNAGNNVSSTSTHEEANRHNTSDLESAMDLDLD